MKVIFSIDTLLQILIFIHLFFYKKRNSLNKRRLYGHYQEYFMQVLNLKIILLMHFCHKIFPHVQVVIYP